MMVKHQFIGLITGLCVLLPLPRGVCAAEEQLPPPEEQSVLETVVVTATRRSAESRDVAAAVTTVAAGSAAELGPGVVAELLRAQPGTFFQQTTPGQGIPIIRGLKGSQILHLVDGIRLNNAFFRDAPNQYLALVDAYALERVEVVRGAAGSLYGADAMGGVVQLLTRDPRPGELRAPARGRIYGSYNSADRGWTLRGEAELTGERAGLIGGASWQDISDREVGGGERIVPSGYRAEAGDLRALFLLGEASDLTLSAQVLEQPSTPRVDELVPGFGQVEPASAQFRFEPNRRSFFHARYRHTGEDPGLESLEIHAARQVITDDRVTQDFGSPEVNREQNESTLDGLTAQVSQRLGDVSLVWGAEFYRDTVRSARQRTDTTSGVTRDVPGRFPDGSTLDSDAAYLGGEWLATERLTLDAGLRYSRFDIELPATAASPSVDLEPDDFTGDVRASFALREKLRLMVNVGRGFRPPNVFDLGTLGPRPGNRFNVANPDLEPETVWSYDLGVKAEGDHWELEAFVFYLDYENKITSVPTGDITDENRVVVRAENRNEVELHGLEVGLRLTLGEGTDAWLNLNYTRGEERDGDGPVVPADRVPPLNGQLGLRWRPVETLLIEPYLLFAGRQDRLSPRDLLDPRIDPKGTDGWWTANVMLAWQARDSLTLGLRLENLGDERYREHGSGIDARGRNVGVWVNADF